MVSIKFIVKSQPNKEGNHLVVLRLIKNRRKKIISTSLYCKNIDFENQEFKKTHPNYRKRNKLLAAIKSKAHEVLDELLAEGIDFTLEDYILRIKGVPRKEQITVLNFFEEKIVDLEESGKIGTGRAYQETKNALFKFTKRDLTFEQLTPYVLDKFEIFMRKRGNQNGGIAFKMRHLRALYNDAIVKNFVSRDSYPFSEYKISKLKIQGNKKALKISEIRRIETLDLSSYPKLQDAQRYFMFSFYTRGMNFIDMMKLEWSNIQDNKIVFRRSKTNKVFNIEILPPVKIILNHYKVNGGQLKYVFPLITTQDSTPKSFANRKHKMLKVFNKNLKIIGVKAGIQDKLTSYVARHSYGTILKEKGIPIEIISESMGHSNIQVTMTYLKDFDNKVIDDANKKLLEDPISAYAS
ncbi:site-specific integrase [Maribacter stanieri]|uniref:site-specific integrase n=1 Tax=Maribacter stanieri TaxID=440514 RepID=UPI002494A671|nr:site-specific integrase [Maribacter stanieri]